MNEIVKKCEEDFLLLLEAGFIAVNQADEDSAKKLFAAAKILNKNSPLTTIGSGYLHLCKLELKQACAMFEQVLSGDPENEMAKTLLGISKSMTPKEGAAGEKILAEALKTSDNPDVKELASTALEFVDKFVKKSPSPGDIMKK